VKKYFLVVFCALLMFTLTGCGKNQVKCTGSYSEEGMKISAEMIADLDANDKVTDATAIFDLGDSNTANQYCSLFKLAETADSGVKVTCSGTKVTIEGYAKMESDDEEDELIGLSKEDFIKAMAEEDFTCK
jgi:hypothetical protein